MYGELRNLTVDSLRTFYRVSRNKFISDMRFLNSFKSLTTLKIIPAALSRPDIPFSVACANGFLSIVKLLLLNADVNPAANDDFAIQVAS
jgi:hypothetical protein